MTDEAKKPKRPGPGRPRFIESPEEFDRRVDEYIQRCVDTDEPITETGLCIALGFKTRQTLWLYGQRPEFADSVSYAKLLVEHEYEKLLREPRCTGAIFALKNKGWSDRQILEHSGPDGMAMPVLVVKREG